jgi:hypothetical protein
MKRANKYAEVADRLAVLMKECDRQMDVLIQAGKEFGRNKLLASVIQFVVIDGYDLDEALGMATPEFGYNTSTGEWADSEVWDQIFEMVTEEVPNTTSMEDILALTWKYYTQK